MTSSPPLAASSSRSRGAPPRRRGRLALAIAVVAWGAAASASRGTLPPAGRDSLPKDRLLPVPFADGEVLTYTIAWLKIEGGEMTLTTTDETTPDGVPVHRIALSAVSNEYVSKFYPVNTRYESWVDARDFLPLRFEKHAREGRYVSDEIEEFDLGRRIAVWRDEQSIRATGPLPERFQDVISSFYYLRTQQLVPGREIRMELYSRGKLYKLVADVQAKEPVETDLGTLEAVRVQPRMLESESAEDRNKGKLFLWFSADARRLPLMARTILPIGSVTARLTRVEGGRPVAAPAPSPSPTGPTTR